MDSLVVQAGLRDEPLFHEPTVEDPDAQAEFRAGEALAALDDDVIPEQTGKPGLDAVRHGAFEADDCGHGRVMTVHHEVPLFGVPLQDEGVDVIDAE